MAIRQDDIRDRKPRIRHSDAQLAALNELYDENEFPSLEQRAALAENIGMYVLAPPLSLPLFRLHSSLSPFLPFTPRSSDFLSVCLTKAAHLTLFLFFYFHLLY